MQTETDHPRCLVLEGASNLRDIGGWRIGDARVRHGQVFRSASLAGLTEADLVTVGALGLVTICDLRGIAESAAAPSRLPAGASRLALPIEPSVGASLRDLLATSTATGEDVVALLRQAYLGYATEHLSVYRGLFEALLDPARRPLLFHCSAGKDRTGFGTALILTALGADRATVLEDYRATERFWRRTHALPEGTPESAARALLGTHPSLLEAALDAAIAPYGSAEAMFEQALGLDTQKRNALREALLA